MKVVAIGSRAFVSGFRLAGVRGIEVEDSDVALRRIKEIASEPDVGIVIISDSVGKPIRNHLNEFRSKKAIPLLYEIPSPGSKREKMEYREMLRQILGV